MTSAALPVSADVAALAGFVRAHPRLLVLTGAGVSTDSGIPDYRDQAGAWKRRQPVSHQDFTGSEAVRRRYWARSLRGYGALAQARPNAAHAALGELEARGHVTALVTQNVDGLHQRAGSRKVVELHGNAHTVSCVECQAAYPRAEVQSRMAADNPRFALLTAAAAPDGDADLETDFDDFRVLPCAACGGVLKPDVVFFGDSVPRPRLEAALDALAESDALLAVGSSLMVYSGYRFCVRAAEAGKPIAAINLGRTRADSLFALKLERPCAAALAGLLGGLEGR